MFGAPLSAIVVNSNPSVVFSSFDKNAILRNFSLELFSL
jgi:hypothetical protein